MINSSENNINSIEIKLATLSTSTKAQSWLIKYKSNQPECLELKQHFNQSIVDKFAALNDTNKIKFDKYVQIHQGLIPLQQEIESNGFKLNTQILSNVRNKVLSQAKNSSHRNKLDKNFTALERAIDDNQKLNTQLTLVGTRTHRITTRNFNVQGLPKEVKQLILATHFAKVFMIDFKAFEPSVVAYITGDKQLKEHLNDSQSLYDALLNNLSLSEEHRKFVKRAFIGSFLFGGNFNSDKFKLNQYVSEEEWNKAINQFSEVKQLKEQIATQKIMPMPYGFEHDMKNHSENSLMAIYVQTVSSYIFKNILFEVYKHQEEQRDFRIMLPIHDAIMIECNTKKVSERVAQLMETSANHLFGENFAHTTIEQMGGNQNDK
ncbi:DNA polymerase [Staphylococcus epidermidis]|nr:DNA polymerase [Staphylococcus epidermidis]